MELDKVVQNFVSRKLMKVLELPTDNEFHDNIKFDRYIDTISRLQNGKMGLGDCYIFYLTRKQIYLRWIKEHNAIVQQSLEKRVPVPLSYS
jgi:hypothetical protein